MQKIDEIKEPQVGKYYLVPCALVKAQKNGNVEFIIPILGIKHTDKQLGVSYEHYHIDSRFCRSSQLVNINEEGRTNNILSTDPQNGVNEFFVAEVQYRKRKCIRDTTGIAPPRLALKYWRWYEEQIGKTCKGKKCPHLGHTMHEKNGHLECPLHGLIGDIKKEVIIDRREINI